MFHYHGMPPCVTLNKGKKRNEKVIIVSVRPQNWNKVKMKEKYKKI